MTDKKFEIRIWVDKIERFKYILLQFVIIIAPHNTCPNF